MDAIELGIDTIQQAYDDWYYTILGADRDLNEWIEGYQKLCNTKNIGTIKQWYVTKGSVLNQKWNLKGNDRFKDDLTILMFDYEGMNIGKLAIFKLNMGDRWFTDIIDNAVSRADMEEEE